MRSCDFANYQIGYNIPLFPNDTNIIRKKIMEETKNGLKILRTDIFLNWGFIIAFLTTLVKNAMGFIIKDQNFMFHNKAKSLKDVTILKPFFLYKNAYKIFRMTLVSFEKNGLIWYLV